MNASMNGRHSMGTLAEKMYFESIASLYLLARFLHRLSRRLVKGWKAHIDSQLQIGGSSSIVNNLMSQWLLSGVNEKTEEQLLPIIEEQPQFSHPSFFALSLTLDTG